MISDSRAGKSRPLRGRTVLATLALVPALSLGGCVKGLIRNARLAETTQQDLQAASRQAHLEVVNNKLLYDDARLVSYVGRVGQRVVRAAQQQGLDPNLILRFHVLDDAEVNAYSNAGGYVYVTRGLLAILRSEDELAAVLGHEVAHVAGGDSLKTVHDTARRGMLKAIGIRLRDQKYARDLELLADQKGRAYATAAGYDPGSMTTVLAEIDAAARWDDARAQARGMKPAPTWSALDDHPSQQARHAALRAVAPAKASRRAPEADYLGLIDGMVWGLSDRVGVHRGGVFYSRANALVLPVPGGWFAHQDNTDASLLFVSPKNTARITFDHQDLSVRTDADGFARESFGDTIVKGGVQRVAGLPYPVWRGTVNGLVNRRRSVLQAVVWTTEDHGYMLLGSRDGDSPLSEAQWLKTFDGVAYRVRPLKPTETALAQAIRVRVLGGGPLAAPGQAPAPAAGRSAPQALPWPSPARPLLRISARARGATPNWRRTARWARSRSTPCACSTASTA